MIVKLAPRWQAVLRAEPAVVPTISLHNDQGVHVFNAIDTDPSWRDDTRTGLVRSVAWIPGNLLSEGTMFVSVFVVSLASVQSVRHVSVHEAVAFQVYDPGEGDSARGDFMGHWGGACRPRLRWERSRA